jgi:hypothetical protein
MGTLATSLGRTATHPVQVELDAPPAVRNRLTVAFRPILGIPHAILVGGPIAVFAWTWGSPDGTRLEWGAGGVLGAVAAVCAIIAWFAILVTGRHPAGLRDLAAYYLRWRARAVAYVMLLRDEFPPFGDGAYGARLTLAPAPAERDRLTVAFRVLLAIPHFVAVCVLGVAWIVATIVAWGAILLNGRHPEPLYRFGAGVMRWELRVEAYVLLLHDEYPPFTLA